VCIARSAGDTRRLGDHELISGTIGLQHRRRIISRHIPQPYATSVGVARGSVTIAANVIHLARLETMLATTASGHHARRTDAATCRAV